MDLPNQNKLYSAQHVIDMEQAAIAKGTSGEELMQRAGRAVADVIIQRFPKIESVHIVCGAGNNAGDGRVVAGLLQSKGYAVTVSSPTDKTEFNAELIVDALLGTGLDREVTGDFYHTIELINRSNTPVLSIDIPSGLDATSGQVRGIAVKATMTVSFIALKQGLFCQQGLGYCGEVIYRDLDIEPDLKPDMIKLDCAYAQAQLPTRSWHTHKGDCGHVLLIGGDYGMAGAINMAAHAAGRAGAGLVSVATQAEHALHLSAQRPEVMAKGVSNPSELEPLLERATVIAIGPGLGRDQWGHDLFQFILNQPHAKVLDADALYFLSQSPQALKNAIITPHPGEAAMLLNSTTEAIQADRVSAVNALQQQYQAVCVLKGAGTLVLGDQCAIAPYAIPAMASGGMGDILTGLLAGLIAQKLNLQSAAQCGVVLHAEAALVAAKNQQRGLLATDLFKPLKHLVNPL